jgi:hypothetical protein
LLAALLAQLVEQLTLNQLVVGSSPTGGKFRNISREKEMRGKITGKKD